MRIHKKLFISLLVVFLSVGIALDVCAGNSAQKANLLNLSPLGSRVALVIGNGDYDAGKLKNPERDAKAMANLLVILGFEVEYYANLDQQAMLKHVFDFFHHKAVNSELRLIYYAGHGIQYQGRNYLVPVDANMLHAGDVPASSFLLDDLRSSLDELQSGASIIILDTCRINICPVQPCRNIVGNLELSDRRRSSGTLIAYSTRPGQLANDGGNNEHSLYTQTLLELLPTPGLPVEKLFRRVTENVYRQSDGKQKPEFIDGLMGEEICLKATSLGKCADDHR